MKKAKKILSILLAVVMLFTAIPMSTITSSAAIQIPDDAVRFSGHYYKVFEESMVWTEAKAYCENLGGYLATITSLEEQNFIVDIAKNTTKTQLWLGGTDEHNEGDWVWITGEEFTYKNWHPGNPDNYARREHYLTIFTDNTPQSGFWNDFLNSGFISSDTTKLFYKLEQIGFVCEWEATTELEDKLSDETSDYIIQHLAFTQSGLFDHYVDNYGFYEEFWQYEEVDRNFTAYSAWEVIGDIGEVVTLKFDDLFVTDNPYDVILADVLSNVVTNSNMDNSADKSLDTVFSINNLYKDFMSLLQSSEKWSDTILNDDLVIFLSCLFVDTKESLINGVFFSPDKMNLKNDYPEAYKKLKELLPAVKNSNWNKVFKGIGNISVITDYINTGADVVETVITAYQKYVIAKALVSTQQDVLNSLEDAANRMSGDAKTQLKKSISSYREVLNYDTAFAAVSNYMVGGSFLNVYNVFKGSLTNLTYTGLAKIFGLASVSSVNAVIVAYNVTYALLDKISGVGAASDIFFILNASALLEKALIKVASSRAEKMEDTNSLDDLENINSLADVAAFDATYGLLQAIEQYCYKGLATYISAMKQQFVFEAAIKSASGNFLIRYFAMKELNEQRSAADRAIDVAVMFEGTWRNRNCHYKNIEEAKLVAVRCPTDVYVYNESGEIELSIVSNKVTKQSADISVIVDGSEKIFSLPDNGKYSIEIVGTDTGTMTYSVYDTEETSVIRYTEYSNVKLSENCVYNGVLDFEKENDSNYELTLTYCEHYGGMATCIAQAICDNCFELYGDVNLLNHTGETETINKREATCKADGYSGDVYCTSCKNIIVSGESVLKVPHSDTNNDNKCDSCGEQLKQDVNTECNHLCHSKNAFLSFIWKIFNFLMRLFSMERYCTCGVAHY